MFIPLMLTPGMIERIRNRQSHFSNMEREYENMKDRQGFLGRVFRGFPKFVYRDKYEFYQKLGNQFAVTLPTDRPVFVTPEEYAELAATVYSFEISANAISASNIVAGKVTAKARDINIHNRVG